MALEVSHYLRNEKVILYIMNSYYSTFFVCFGYPLYISSTVHFTVFWVQSNYHDIYSMLAVLSRLSQVLSLWLVMKFRLGIFLDSRCI